MMVDENNDAARIFDFENATFTGGPNGSVDDTVRQEAMAMRPGNYAPFTIDDEMRELNMSSVAESADLDQNMNLAAQARAQREAADE